MNLYNVILFVHILATLTLFMAIAIETLCLHRMRAATTTGQLREWAGLVRTVEKPLPISTIGVLVTGLYLSLTVWDLTVPWIGLSLAVVAVMMVVGPAVNSRRLAAIATAAQTAPSGPIPADLAHRIQDGVLLVSIHTLAALGFGIVFLKAVKPGLIGALAVLASAVILGMLSARRASHDGSIGAEAPTITTPTLNEPS